MTNSNSNLSNIYARSQNRHLLFVFTYVQTPFITFMATKRGIAKATPLFVIQSEGLAWDHDEVVFHPPLVDIIENAKRFPRITCFIYETCEKNLCSFCTNERYFFIKNARITQKY